PARLDHQPVALLVKAHVHIELVAPHRAAAGHECEVVATAGLPAQIAVEVGDPTAVAHDHLVVTTERTHRELRAVAPERAAAGDEREIVAAGRAAGEEAVVVLQKRAITHHEPAQRAVAADEQRATHAPARAGGE